VGCIYGESQEQRTDLTTSELSMLEELRDALASAIARLKRRPALAIKPGSRC